MFGSADFDYVDFQFNSIQIVALQENPFNTKCITKDTKHSFADFADSLR
jgi:hypothetical protein